MTYTDDRGGLTWKQTILIWIGLIIALIVVLAVIGIYNADQDVVNAKNAIERSARDPSSIEYKNVDHPQGLNFVCGEFNGKNGFGGYAGYTLFYFKGGVLLTGDAAYNLISEAQKSEPFVCSDATSDFVRANINRALSH